MTFGEGCATGPNLSLWNVCGDMILQKYFFFFWMLEVDKDFDIDSSDDVGPSASNSQSQQTTDTSQLTNQILLTVS